MNKKILSIFVLVLTLLFSTQAFASLTFTSNAITGTTASSIDLGSGNTLSLNTTNNAPITTGTGLVTLGGSLKVVGLNAGNVPVISTGGSIVDAGFLHYGGVVSSSLSRLIIGPTNGPGLKYSSTDTIGITAGSSTIGGTGQLQTSAIQLYDDQFDTSINIQAIAGYPNVGLPGGILLPTAGGLYWGLPSDLGLIRSSAGVLKITDGSAGSGSILAGQYKLSALNTAPTTSSEACTAGEIRYTATYIYLCSATNTWVRSAFSSF